MTFKRLDSTKELTSKTKYPWYYGFLAFIFLLGFWLQEYAVSWEKDILFLLGLLVPVLNGLWSKAEWFKEEEVIGALEINAHEIIVDAEQERFPIQDVAAIKLTSNDYIDNKYYLITSSKSSQLRGVAEIEISTKNNETSVFRFVIENKEQWNDFKKVIQAFYQKGIQMEEYLGYKKRAYLLEPLKSKRNLKSLAKA